VRPIQTANLANVAAVLKMAFPKISWVGFYVLKGRELVLGPFQGKPACVRIQPGKGVCGTSCLRQETVIVPDVGQFPGHIVCDPDSRSEIVVPVVIDGRCVGVLDVDSAELNSFDAVDQEYLEQIVSMLLLHSGVRNVQETAVSSLEILQRLTFLNSPDARSLRILSEFLQRFEIPSRGDP